jgi:hypothetical protein
VHRLVLLTAYDGAVECGGTNIGGADCEVQVPSNPEVRSILRVLISKVESYTDALS